MIIDKIKKHRLYKRIFFIGCCCFFISTINAVPAYRRPVVVKQPDGHYLTMQLHGDEHYNYRTTIDGYLISENSGGFYEYAKRNAKGEVQLLGVAAHDAQHQTAVEKVLLQQIHPVDEMQMVELATAGNEKTILRKSPSATRPLRTMPLSGSPRSLVILVNFTDKSYSVSNPQVAYFNLLNQQGYAANGGTGSARDYFRDNSNGQFNPQFDVVGPYTLPNNMAFYGGNSSGSDKNPRQMVIDACALADAAGVDFAQYDTDNDGYVDNIFVYYAGYNEAEGASANTVWPHRWTLANISTKYDGKIVFDYACTSELKGTSGTNMCGVGTFVHEFGHVLGLPDFYATNSATHHTLFSWDVMDYGPYNNSGRTPPNYSSYEKFFLGWLTPVELKTPQNVSLDTLVHSNKAYLVSKTGAHNMDGQNPSPSEFFMMENRQLKGWDAYLPGHGLLLTHVYYNSSAWGANSVNNTSTAMGVDIVEADGTATDASCSGDPFPGTSKISTYTPQLRDGSTLNKPLSNIKELNGIVSFQFMGGEFSVNNAPQAIAATNIKQTSFTANWSAVQFADTYLLDVFSVLGKDTTFVTGFKSKDVGNVSSFNVAGLKEEQVYSYRIRAVSGTVTTIYSNVIQLSTLSYTFDMFSPMALPATNITNHAFTANWNALSGATSYLLNVYTKVAGTQVTDSLFGFDFFPVGWSKNFTLTYTSSSMYGYASPSLRMSYANDYLQTALYPDLIASAQFWYRGSGLLGSNALNIYGSSDGINWNIIKSILTLQNTSQTVQLTGAELANSSAIKIVFSKTGSGSLGIDDVKLSFYKTENKTVPGMDALAVGNVVSYNLSGLQPFTNYYYTVVALNNQLKSATSNEVQLVTAQDVVSQLYTPVSGHSYQLLIGSQFVEFRGESLKGGAFRLINIHGQTLLQARLTENSFRLNRSALEHGVYIVEINEERLRIVL